MKFNSKCLHSGYEPQDGEPQALPIYQSTTYRYRSADKVAALFDLTDDGFFYTRLANPTTDAVERKIADLEGGIGALCTSSGQAASFMAVVNILNAGDDVEFVTYPTVPSYKHKDLAKKYLPKGASGVIAFSLKAGRDAGKVFIDSLKLCSLVVHVADIRTCVLHPASSTHRQMNDRQLEECGVTPGLIRLSVGLEDIDDIIEDLTQALDKATNN